MPPKKNLKNEIPEGVPQGLWDMLVSIKTDTAATSLRADTLEARVDELEEQQTGICTGYEGSVSNIKSGISNS
jgi:hypothetical protein